MDKYEDSNIPLEAELGRRRDAVNPSEVVIKKQANGELETRTMNKNSAMEMDGQQKPIMDLEVKFLFVNANGNRL